MSRLTKCLLSLSLLASVACQRQERVEEPRILGGNPKVLYSGDDPGLCLSRTHSESPWLELRYGRKTLWLNLDDLTTKEDDGTIDDKDFEGAVGAMASRVLGLSDAPIRKIELLDSAARGDWEVSFKGRFVERNEHFGQGEGLIPNTFIGHRIRRFTGDVIFRLRGEQILKHSLIETPVDAEYPFTFDYSASKGILAYHYHKDFQAEQRAPAPDDYRLYVFKFPPRPPDPPMRGWCPPPNPRDVVPSMEVTITDSAVPGVTNVPKPKKH